MIISSFHRAYSFDSSREDKYSYHTFSLRKTLEFSYLWYLYMRTFLGKDIDILLIDQGSDYPIESFLEKTGEKYSITSINDYSFDKNVKLHVKKFEQKCLFLKGVKRLYQYMFRFCYYNNIDFFYIENDCLVAKDVFTLSQPYDFMTNTIDIKHRVCDTYLNFIKLSKLKEQDELMPFIDYLNLLEKHDANKDEKDVCPSKDLIYKLTNERGIYLKYCYGNVLCFNWDGIYHHGNDQELINFLEKYPIDHPFYEYFIKKGKEIINEKNSI